MAPKEQQLPNSSTCSGNKAKFDVLIEKPNSVKLTQSGKYAKELVTFPPGTILQGLSEKDGRVLVVVDITNLVEQACLDHNS